MASEWAEQEAEKIVAAWDSKDTWAPLVSEALDAARAQGRREGLEGALELRKALEKQSSRSTELRDQLFRIKIWLEYLFGTKRESRHSTDCRGHINNSWGVVPIPDWGVRQKIDQIEKAIQQTDGEGSKLL